MGQYTSEDQAFPRLVVPSPGTVTAAALAPDAKTGAIAKLDSSVAVKGSITYYDGNAWVLLAPPVLPSVLRIDGNGNIAWVAL